MADEKIFPDEEFTIDDTLLEEAEKEHDVALALIEAAAKPKTKRGRKKKTETADIKDGIVEDVTPTDVPKPKRGRKKKSEATDRESDVDAIADLTPAEDAPKPKRGRKKKSEATDRESTVDAISDLTPAEDAPKPKRGRKKKDEANKGKGVTPVDGVIASNDGDDVVDTDDNTVDVIDLATESIDSEVFAGSDFLVTIDDIYVYDQSDATETEITDTALGSADIEIDNAEAPIEEAVEPEFVAPTVRVRKKEAKYNPDSPRKIDYIFDFIELFVYTLVAVLVITTFFIRHSIVDGPSMESTLQSGDTLIISNVFYTPTQGDVVVVDDHTTGLPYPIVKRVIATEGQWIRIARDGVYVDGVKLDEPYVFTDGLNFVYTTRLPGEALKENPTFRIEPPDSKHGLYDYYELQVPAGEIFIMGDHRNESTDSRVIGTVRVDAVLGKVLFRVLPFSSFGAIE